MGKLISLKLRFLLSLLIISPVFSELSHGQSSSVQSSKTNTIQFVDCKRLQSLQYAFNNLAHADSGHKVNWAEWAPFLPAIELEYKIRYQQHFSVQDDYPSHIPTGREFYEQPWKIDGGRLLYERFRAGEKNVVDLLLFGWQVDLSVPNQPRFLPPPTFVEYLNHYYVGLHKKYMNHGITIDELPVPTLPFIRIHRKGNLTSDSVFLRIGVDPPPNPKEWRLALAYDDNIIDVPLDVLSEILAKNKPPLNPCMFDHDNAHLIDNINYPGFYLANQEFFSRIAGQHPTKSTLKISTDSSKPHEFAAYARGGIMHEETVIPNLLRRKEIENFVPEIFKYPDLANVEKNKSFLRQTNSVARAKYLTKHLPALITRHGGGMSDPYNLYNDLNVRTTPTQRLKAYLQSPTGFSRFFQSKGRELFSQAAVESLLGMSHDIQFIAELLSNPKETHKWIRANLKSENPKKMYNKMKEILIDRMARVEIALYMGVKKKITAEKIAYETTDQFVDKNSDSYQYLKSFVLPDSFLEQIYLHPAAVR